MTLHIWTDLSVFDIYVNSPLLEPSPPQDKALDSDLRRELRPLSPSKSLSAGETGWEMYSVIGESGGRRPFDGRHLVERHSAQEKMPVDSG